MEWFPQPTAVSMRPVWPPLEQYLAYLDAALLTCSVCELLNSLESEVKLIWQGSRNTSQVCHILARYICIASFVVYLAGDAPQLSVPGSNTYNENRRKTDWLLNINLLFVELIFSLRTWALWERSKTIGVWLGVLMVLLWCSSFGLVIPFTVTSLDGGNVGWMYFISFAAFYFIIMILVTIKAYRARHELNISLIRLVHVQCLTYYALLFAMSLSAVVIAWLGDPNGFIFVTRLTQFVFAHMACRMSLSLRDQNSRPVINLNSKRPYPREENTSIPLSDLNFRHSLGATDTTGTSCLPDRPERPQPQGDLPVEPSSFQAIQLVARHDTTTV